MYLLLIAFGIKEKRKERNEKNEKVEYELKTKI